MHHQGHRRVHGPPRRTHHDDPSDGVFRLQRAVRGPHRRLERVVAVRVRSNRRVGAAAAQLALLAAHFRLCRHQQAAASRRQALRDRRQVLADDHGVGRQGRAVHQVLRRPTLARALPRGQQALGDGAEGPRRLPRDEARRLLPFLLLVQRRVAGDSVRDQGPAARATALAQGTTTLTQCRRHSTARLFYSQVPPPPHHPKMDSASKASNRASSSRT